MRFVDRAFLLIALITVFPSPVTGQVTYRYIALSNEPAPGADAVFLRFSNPVINAVGNVAFQATPLWIHVGRCSPWQLG